MSSSGILKTILVLGLVGVIGVYNLGFCQSAKKIKAVTMIKIFFDQAQTQELQKGATLHWGKICSGVWTLTLYVNNTGNVDVILGFNNRGNLPKGWIEYWDYDDTPLVHNELRTVTITLEVPEDVTAGVYKWGSSITATRAHL